MANRVNVDVHVRDLTRPELERMRRGFRRLGQDLDRMVSARTQGNFERLGRSVAETRQNLASLRGVIPDDEFFRLDDAIRRADRQMRRGFGRQTIQSMRQVADAVQEVRDGLTELDRAGRIRPTVDEDGLRTGRRRIVSWLRSLAGLRARVGVDVDESGARRWTRRLSRLLLAPLRGLAGTVGGILQDGIGQGIINGVRAAGPVVGTVLVAAILAALSAVGAALSGILVTALGAAFIGISAVSAAQSKTVKDQWKKTLASLKENFVEVGEPMIPVLTRALKIIEDMADRAAPVLKKAVEDATPATNKFIDGLLEGFERFGEEAFKPIMEAWDVFAPVFGEVWSDFMAELGAAFADMAKLVKEHPTEIAAALRGVLQVIVLIVEAITLLGKAWVLGMSTAGDSLGFVIEAFADLQDAILDTVSKSLHALAFLADIIPGIGDKAKNAAERFDEWKDTATSDLHAMADKAFDFGESLDRANKVRRLDADISSWEFKLQRAREQLKKTTDQKAKAKLEADISDLQNKIQAAQSRLNELNGKTVRSYVYTIYQDIHTSLDQRKKRHGLAHGGVRGLSAAATGGARNNMTLVGEQGPEIVNLAPGSRVRSNSDTRRILRQGDQEGGAGFTLEINSSGSRVDDLIVEVLRRAVKARGGNVQFGVMGRA